jgi:NADH:ubiquinone oxidoreductase subunit 5 (subunit L)/multisubunit Na+/H+ antiporter MnhA subunit
MAQHKRNFCAAFFKSGCFLVAGAVFHSATLVQNVTMRALRFLGVLRKSGVGWNWRIPLKRM